MIYPDCATVERLRSEFPDGSRVELIRMNDKAAPPVGTRGTVRGVDALGSVMVEWDNGSSIGRTNADGSHRRRGDRWL